MKHESLQRTVVSSLVALLLTALWTASAIAQETPQPGAAEQPPAAAATDANAAKKPKGRLPAYYGKVVTDKQREQIYEIQAKFTEQIVKLQEQLNALAAKRDAEIEQVLTDEQRAEIARLKSERKARRTNGSAEDAPPNGS
jgi:predicted house-cleaning noncanonical NTP pyrophosphatase (MazG superfamily)